MRLKFTEQVYYAVIDEFIGNEHRNSPKPPNLPISDAPLCVKPTSAGIYEIGQCPPHWRIVVRYRNMCRSESFKLLRCRSAGISGVSAL